MPAPSALGEVAAALHHLVAVFAVASALVAHRLHLLDLERLERDAPALLDPLVEPGPARE